ncbi:MAG TPA: tRNA (adenosine(37)-N6)-threonylcarbamoyltransferase complex transferase subunit TsaD [Planctomycetota bacterium]|nr:tRNA (adenosine(37)-N6)-threonylcarbamoyltransferase complex transferase subunit TsaD [Planctomycetota bacterium]
MASSRAVILGIESSCDETAAAVVVDGREVLSNAVISQIDLHAVFGGVVPELACRAHVQAIVPVVDKALADARVAPEELTAVAVTNTPGLVGALLVGIAYAKSLAFCLEKPLYGVDHLHGHMYASRMAFPDLEDPCVNLIVSGGHTSLYLSRGPLDHTLIGSTRDDAAGEAFDKVANILGLPFPGGPAIDKLSKGRDPGRVSFKRTLLEEGSLDFSFSGIKTAVLYAARGQDAKGDRAPTPERVADLAAGFQEAVVDVLLAKSLQACKERGVPRLAVGGGVACNSRLRSKGAEQAAREGIRVYFPPPAWCTDNAAMIAGVAYHLWRRGPPDRLTLDAVPTKVYRR